MASQCVAGDISKLRESPISSEFELPLIDRNVNKKCGETRIYGKNAQI